MLPLLDFLHFLNRKLTWDTTALSGPAAGDTYPCPLAHSFRPDDHPCSAARTWPPNCQQCRPVTSTGRPFAAKSLLSLIDSARKKCYFFFQVRWRKMAQSTENKIISRIRGTRMGWAFSPRDFLDLGERPTFDSALHRLVQQGNIRRIIRGVYDFARGPFRRATRVTIMTFTRWQAAK